MSKIFYDHLVSLDALAKSITVSTQSLEEKEELWQLIDETIHHKVLGCILDNLPRKNHTEFLEKFHTHPHDETLLVYLKEKIGRNIEELIKAEIGTFAFEILEELRARKKI